MAGPVNYLSLFIPTFLVLFTLQLLIPCVSIAMTDPEDQSICINSGIITGYFNNLGIETKGFIGGLLTVLSLFESSLTCLFWTFNVQSWINIILTPLRIIGLYALYKVVQS